MRRTQVLSRLPGRRWVASVVAVVLTAGLLVVAQPPAPAAAAGPSVELPNVPSVPVAPESMAARPTDPATAQAVSGNQPTGGSQGAGQGTPTATSLSPSATWSVSESTGDFSWSYPLRVPPVPGGLAPDLALSYRSSAVDGRTSVTNNQPSWVGDGWELNPGFVERTYGSCSQDKQGNVTPPINQGDLCWRSYNATATYGGSGGALIRDDRTGQWRQAQDNGSRIERLENSGNGARNGEYWKITTVDGTQYFFGSRPESKSTWTVPVFGDDSGEPCHDPRGFSSSHCTQAWRWNLDRVVDANGNQILFSYQSESNTYGMNLQDPPMSYVRGGWLERIDYGSHTTAASSPAARVLFSTADRCVPGSACTLDRPENWPDTPLDERCGANCYDHHFPTFWTTKRLASVTTQVWRGDRFADVDRWTLEQQYPKPGDGEKPALWLRSITHTGLVGGSVSLPPVTFEGQAMPNRVHQGDGLSPLLRYRIIGIVSEAGGLISVNYAQPDCVPGQSMPANAHTNTMRCFPVTWNRPGFAERTDWFHKYVVESVTLSDRIGSNLTQQTSYEYLDGAAWRYDTSEFTPDEKRTWNEFRGFGRVRVRQGRASDPGGPVTMTEQRFSRGMDGDRREPSGGTKPVVLTDSEGGTHTDHDWLSGLQRESITYLGESETLVQKTLTDPVWQGPTATRGAFKAYIVRPGAERTYVTLENGQRRVTEVRTEYDDRGLATAVNDLGDTSTAADDLCTRTAYVRNITAWILQAPSQVETVSRRCEETPSYPDDAVSGRRLSYDGQNWGAAPQKGNLSRTDVLDERPASGAVYAVEATARHDVHGRVTEATDALGKTTTTAYTPVTGGPTTRTVVTDPMRFTTTTDFEPALGQPVTVTDVNGNSNDTAYDPLGRVSEVWTADRARKWGFPPSYRFSYLIRRDAPTVVTTTRLGPNGSHVSANQLYDGLLRLRQTQEPAVGGGRLIVDTRYDSQGRVYKTTNPYFNDAPVDTTLWRAADVDIPGHTVTTYDGAGRPAESIQMDGAEPLWRSTNRYGGDRTYFTPPPGGTPTAVVTDARGRTVEIHQYLGSFNARPADITRYSHTPAGQLASVVDPAGNTWRFRYDLRGRLEWSDDPDKGETSMVYDEAGQLVTQTDARGEVTAYEYDDLGRSLSIRAGGPDGDPLVEWTYDTVPFGKGQPATSTSHDADGNAYTSRVLSYTASYQPIRTSVTIPEADGLGRLAGVYESSVGYNPDGSVASETHPAVGGLFEEEVRHTYDDMGRPLTTYGGPAGTTVHYASRTDYTRYGELHRLHLGSGTKRAWQTFIYDEPTRRLHRTIVDAELPRPQQANLHYRYDPAGNVTSIADTTLERPADIQCYRYDHLRRLTEAWTPTGDPERACAVDPTVGTLGGPAPYWQSYTYDVVGNRRTQVQHLPGGDITRTYSYPNPGSERPHAVSAVSTTGAGTTTYDYDDAGNTTVRGDQEFDWDAQGRLTTVTEGAQETSFVYDAAGERLIRRDPTGATLYLGDQELRFDSNSGTLTGTRYYTHGGHTVGVRTISSGVTWLFSDHHGTAVVAVDSVNLTATVRRHDPFGNPRGAGPASWPGERGFVGGTMDESTGLTHLGAREYDPVHGRFISVDPVLNPSDPQQMNGYSYANNNPTTLSDPEGLIPDYCGVDVNCYGYNPHNGCPYGCGTAANQAWGESQGFQGPVKDKKPPTKIAGTNYTTEDYEEAQKTKKKRVIDVVIEAGGEVLKEFLGINDIVSCFGDGDFGACVSMIIGAIPWTKLHRIGELIGAVKRAWKAVTGFFSQRKHANEVIAAVESACGVGGGKSFSADTEVLMADGTTKPISEIEPGDRVIATDPETGERSAQTVTAVWVHEDDVVDLQVQWAGGFGEDAARGALATITTTHDHPFWNHTEQQWQPAGALDPGDELLAADGSRAAVVGLLGYTAHETAAYNLTVTDVHTYYVVAGETPVLVHNDTPEQCFRGARSGDAPSFAPRPGEYKVDPQTGFVKDTHGVSVFDNPESVAGKGFVPHGVDMSSVPSTLRIIQRGKDPQHFEIVPAPGANLTPEEYTQELAKIRKD